MEKSFIEQQRRRLEALRAQILDPGEATRRKDVKSRNSRSRPTTWPKTKSIGRFMTSITVASMRSLTNSAPINVADVRN
ncbi:hypothetical protein ASE05_29760 [Mesorhizobium sp. Root172]|nr:hypothetical protein ASE05_29760 [Mesorhizobium sp. Root172]